MIYDCIVIGAGPGGIVATKELIENGIEHVICLEKSDRLGGVFAASYDNLVLTSSVTFSMFSDYWVGEGRDHDFWTKDEAVNYWTDYANHYKVTDHIRFGSEVISVVDSGQGSWKVMLQSGETFESKRLIFSPGSFAR